MSEYVDALNKDFAELSVAALKLQQAVWNTEQQIVKLEIENRSLREALRQWRQFAYDVGCSPQMFASQIGITAAQLSVWTDGIPTTEPDFKD